MTLPADLRVRQFTTLTYLVRYGARTVTEVAAHLHVSHNTALRALKALIREKAIVARTETDAERITRMDRDQIPPVQRFRVRRQTVYEPVPENTL